MKLNRRTLFSGIIGAIASKLLPSCNNIEKIEKNAKYGKFGFAVHSAPYDFSNIELIKIDPPYPRYVLKSSFENETYTECVLCKIDHAKIKWPQIGDYVELV